MDTIIRFSLHNRLLVLVAAVLLMLGGLYTAQHTEVDIFPDLNAPTVVVMTEAGGMATEEIEQLVTFPIETAMNGATNVRRVRSSSTTGFSVVWVEFEWNTDIYLARQIVSEKLATIGESLPQGVGQPVLGPQSSILGELLIVGLTADSTSLLDLRTLADWTVRPRLLSTGGVAQVSVIGGDIKEYQIQLSPQRMRHYGVTLADVMQATRQMNTNVNGGVIYEFGNEYIVRGILSTSNIEALSRTVVRMNDVAPITLSDVATVRIGAQEPRLGIASERGKPAVLLTVTKQPATGTIELTKRLEEALADVQKNLPSDVHVSTDIFRQSRFIDSAISNVQQSLLEGALFVIIILALFLANVRTTVISLITLPISLLVAIIVLHLLDLTINTMSLGGLAIAIGSLVDDAIVDVENVWKRLRGTKQAHHLTSPEGEETLTTNPLPSGEEGRGVIYEASREVRMPILNSTLIIVTSFTPLFFLSGMEGRMLIPLGVAFIVALFASTAVALTLTPVLCSYLLTGKATTQERREPFVIHHLQRLYSRLLDWTLNHQRSILSATAAIFILAVGCFFTLGRGFLPPFNEGSLTINVSLLPGISLQESDRIGRQAEQILLSIPEIQTVARKTGRAELDEHALGVNTSEIEAPYALTSRSHQAFMQDVRQKLSIIQGANIEIGQPISHRIDAMLSGTQANIAIKLFGTDLHRMYLLGNRIKETISDVDGIADLNVEQLVQRPELKITPNRELLLRHGISLPEFREFVAVNLSGEVVSEVNEGGKRFQLVVRTEADSRQRMEQIRDLVIDAADGRKIPITNVATVESSMGPNTINRENVQRKLVISANTAGRDLQSVVEDIRQRIDEQIQLPEGYHIEYGGQFESAQSASRTLLLVSLFSVIVIFLLIYMEFRSVVESAVILLNLPLALIGGVFALCLTTGEISIPAIIGFISLFGIATRNGMLLISRYNALHHSQPGLSLRQCVMMGSADRLNPILMTALTSAFALIPLALGGDQPGGEIQSPMAKVILGGLITSTILNALLIPIIYLRINQEKD